VGKSTTNYSEEVLVTPKSHKGKKSIGIHKLTSPGLSLEVQDAGKFLAEP